MAHRRRHIFLGLVLAVAALAALALILRAHDPDRPIETSGQATPVPTARPDGLHLDVIDASAKNLRNFLSGQAGEVFLHLYMQHCPGECVFATEVQAAIDQCNRTNPPIDYRKLPLYDVAVHGPILAALEASCQTLASNRAKLGPPADTPAWREVRLEVRELARPRAEWYGPGPSSDFDLIYRQLKQEAGQHYYFLSAYAKGCGDYPRVGSANIAADCPNLIQDFVSGMKQIVPDCTKTDARQLQHISGYDPALHEPLLGTVARACDFLQLVADQFGQPQDNESWHTVVKLAQQMLEPLALR